MFPLSEGHFAARNRWYIAAWSDEITRTPIERWILDEPVALYRQENGVPVGLDGRCPHHLYPLGKSGTKNDNIVCDYHGLEFQPDGTCIGAPFLEGVPGACNVKSYQLREKWNWIWIWPGDPELADESLIPDHFEIGVTNPAYHAVRGLRLDIAARYQLLNDNLLDLQHLEVLHAGILGNDGIGQADEERGSGEDWILSARKMRDIELPKAFQPFFGQRRVDRTLTMNWHIPGLHVGPDIFTVPEGEPDAGREIMQVIAYHALTPARRNSCHYFVTFARSFAHGDEAVDQAMLKSFRGVLDQDVFAAEEIEKQLQNASTPQKEILFKSDATLVIGRRLLEQIIAAETT